MKFMATIIVWRLEMNNTLKLCHEDGRAYYERRRTGMEKYHGVVSISILKRDKYGTPTVIVHRNAAGDVVPTDEDGNLFRIGES